MNMQRSTHLPGSLSRVEVTNAFMRSVYNWMGLGLGITAVISWVLSYTSFRSVMLSPGVLTFGIVAIIAELGLVMYLSWRINKLSAAAASIMFLIYSALNGFTLSFALMQYEQTSVAQAFLTTTGMFAAISLYGLFTKRDLSSIGSYAIMALLGLIIAMIVNFFLRSTMLEFGISCVGILIFVGLTAYHTQLYKEMGENMPQDDATAVRRGTIIAALSLYLDFINMFLMLLRLMGNRN